MQLHDIIKSIQNFFHSLVSSLKPALDLAAEKAGEDGLILAENVLASFAEGTSWSVIVAAFLPQAEALGKKLLVEEASAVLNLAKANVLAKNLNTASAASAALSPDPAPAAS